MMSCFEDGLPFLNLFGKGMHEKGLYNNQHGAIGAAMSHFSINSEPALITMPTGTGKTAVMIVLSYILRAKKVLVITPSQLVRNQITGHFSEAKLLVRNNILSEHHLPKVYQLTKEETSIEAWLKIIANNDVCVAIPGTLNKIIEKGEAIPAETFDLIFVDEAHHSRAPSWTNILNYFSSAKQILLTATPFRRDKKDIKARLIYNYPLKQAYEEGLFSKIDYKPVVRTAEMSDEQINIAIAKQTDTIYKARAHPSHKIIIRTDSKAKAVELDHIYKNNTDLKLAFIHSGLTEATITKRIEELKNGEVNGIICVDMMGEGYDYPSLKIAAIHVPHKSLAITLQFVGRIARTNIEESKIATVIASDHDFAIESTYLYQENRDWSIILPDLHRTRIGLTEEEQRFADTFETQDADEEEIIAEPQSLDLELENFLPFFHVKVYRLFSKKNLGHQGQSPESEPALLDIFKPIEFSAASVLTNPVVLHKTISRENNVIVYVISQNIPPPWLIENSTLKNITNELIIIYYNITNSILFICSTVKETELYELIATSVIESDGLHEMIHLPILKRTMAGWQNEKMYNLGMKSRKTKGNDEAYKQTLGPQVQKSILPSDKFGYTRGHSFGGAFDSVLKKEVLLGISTSSKVWCLDEKKIVYFIQWCSDLARKIGDPEMDSLAMPLADLDAGKIIEKLPTDQIFFADWDSSIYSKNTMVGFIDAEGTFIEEALLCSCSAVVKETTSDHLKLSITKGLACVDLMFTIIPIIGYTYAEETPCKIAIRQGAYSKDLDQFLIMLKGAPIHIYFEDFSFLAGKVLFSSTLTIGNFPAENILKVLWPINVNVQREFLTPLELEEREAGNTIPLSIHEYILENAKNECDVVFYDHGSLEIADIIGFSATRVVFYHCKKQGSDQPRCSVDDMYEVIGQAVKSVHWSNRKFLIEQLIKRADKNNINEKIKKGSIQVIRNILESFDNPIIPVEITIVQPGLKSDNHNAQQIEAFNRINILLAGAEAYLTAVSSCSLKVLCS